jgi:hypothetical protein
MKTQKTHRHLASLLVAVAAFTVACADSATAPGRTLVGNAPSLTIDTIFAATFPPGWTPFGITAGKVQLCKTANAPGTFGFSVVVNGGAATHVDIQVTVPGTPVCTQVFQSNVGNGPPPDVVVITEDPNQTNWALTAINTTQFLGVGTNYPAPRTDDVEDLANRKVTVHINNDMARRTTFTNTFTEPPATGCVYTKGWYKNKNGAPTVIAVDGRTKAEAQAIFLANPGKPNGVSWGSDNLLLNLYQQLLAALNNLGGDANEDDGPAAVDAAIDDAQDGTGGSGLNITTTLTHDEMAALVATLSAFNEGTFAGFPHCPDTPID